MENIFKTFRENKRLSEENKILKAQIESLMEYKKNFDDFYHKITDVKIFEKNYDKNIILTGTFDFDDFGMNYCPVDICKRQIINSIANELEPYVEFELIDNKVFGRNCKSLIGRLKVLTR